MYKTIASLGLVLMMVGMEASCGLSDDTQEKTPEQARLVQSFSAERSELQQHIAEIVTAAKARNYQEAMNKLALLSATTRLTQEQKIAVDFMTRQLRYDMEEEIFSDLSQPKVSSEPAKNPQEKK
ncbi:MAG: hypothetical protein COB54_01750 [Alphaproteobacteria bacterium]|nr:MAG: hypothetical protein COB54_01750 [Alphaproteobacteria bacterium]